MPITKRIFSRRKAQGTDESLTYTANLQKWADEWGNPVSVASCTLYDQKEKKYVNEKLSGTAGMVGVEVESKTVAALEAGHYYQLNIVVNFPDSQVLSGFWLIVGER